MVRNLRNLLLAGCLLIFLATAARADDWPNWRGPNHNGVSTETGWTAQWPAEGPRRLWKASVGVGFSTVSVANGRAYTMGNKGDMDSIYCFDSKTGKVLWKQSYRCALDPHYYEGGPSATPTIDGNSVFTISKTGDIFCCQADTGKVVWSKNIERELGLEIPTWGFASSALVDGTKVIFNVGTFGVALDKNTGKVIWKTGTAPSGYSTPVPCRVDQTPAIAIMTSTGAAGVASATGQLMWQHLWKANYKLNIADPIVVDDKVFLSCTYATNDMLLRIDSYTVQLASTPRETLGAKAKVLWQNKDLENQLNSSVLIDGYIYGIAGLVGPTPNSSLRCIDWQTGSLKWDYPDVGGGALMVADKKIIVLSDKGELFVGAASPNGFTPISRAQVLGGRCWTVPVLANGQIYCRNAKGDLICLDVSGR